MAVPLTQVIQNQITAQDIDRRHTFEINDTDFTDYLMNWSVSHDRKFGSSTATFVLNNNDSNFGSGGANEIKIGDRVELIETFGGDTTQFKRFYGLVEQRNISKSDNQRSISLSCLDYISVLQKWDIDAEYEGTKVEVTEETLTPNYLSAPNDMFAQLFDFANDSIADNPRPILMIRNKIFNTDDVQSDGFDIYYDAGQVKFGAPLNARDNHNAIARSYWFYTVGVYVEDILENLLTTADGYGKFLFGESTAAAVLANHLKTNYQEEDGAGYLDYLTPNLTTSTIIIRHSTSVANSAGATSIVLDSVEGIPASGSGTLNGDIFTWSGLVAHTKTLTGIPATGSNALKTHPINSCFEYSTSYAAGRVWYLKFSNLITDLVAANFTIPGASLIYFDKRNGRIILDTAISTTAIVRCNYNYEFKTLQATGIELNKISFRSRELANRYEAVQKLKDYLAPNYILRTIGDNKIWASYLSQRVTADYTLNLIESINYQEDEDIYTRVKFYRKNKAPTNIMFNDNVDFVTTGQTYRGVAGQVELSFVETVDGWHVYKSLVSDAGKIVLDAIDPIVYIDGIAIDNTLRQQVAVPVIVRSTTRTETTTESSKYGGTDVSVRTYYYYQIHFAHQNIEPSQTINLYNPNGTEVMTISPNDSNMNYGKGVYYAPGDQQNETLEKISTSSYWVMYSTNCLQIDYDNVKFKINSIILPDPTEATIRATFEYYTTFTPSRGVGAIIDGRWDTQVQTEFYTQPPSGYQYAIIDLGSIQEVQALDIVAGFYRPDEIRKFDIDMRLSLQYSTDNISYTSISDSARSFSLTGGQSISFEEEDLGIGFTVRYILVIIENLQKIDYGNGVYVAAFTEVSAYTNIVISSEATLIPTTQSSSTVTSASTTINVISTEGFTEPSSGGTSTAYIEEQAFTYSGLTSTSFIGCVVSSGVSEASEARVHQSIAGDTTLYDDDGLLQQLGDRIYKDISVSDDILYTQAQLDDLAQDFLREFLKEHSKIAINILYAPYLKVGQTAALTDAYNSVSGVNYFIEAVNDDSNGQYTLVLARYPS